MLLDMFPWPMGLLLAQYSSYANLILKGGALLVFVLIPVALWYAAPWNGAVYVFLLWFLWWNLFPNSQEDLASLLYLFVRPLIYGVVLMVICSVLFHFTAWLGRFKRPARDAIWALAAVSAVVLGIIIPATDYQHPDVEQWVQQAFDWVVHSILDLHLS